MERVESTVARRAHGRLPGLALAWSLALAIPASALTLTACSGASAEAWVAPDRAAELVRGGATLLDVRTPGEFASGHPAEAVNVPVDQVASRMSEIDRSQPVVVYCAAGVRSARAAAVLRAAGYEVHDLGTVERWAAQ